MAEEQEIEQEDKAPAEPVYPPGTYHLMSWASVSFIQAPSSRVLQGVVLLLALLALLGGAACFVIEVDLKVPASGEIVADPAIKRVLVPTEGILAELRKAPGDPVKKGEIVALLQMALREDELEAILARLRADVPGIEAVSRRVGLPEGLELGDALGVLRDPELFDAAASLKAAHRELQQSLAGDGGYVKDKNSFVRLNQLLEGKLASYLERHRVRSTAEGTVASVDAALQASVRQGDALISVLPAGASLVARLELPSKEVPDIRAGQRVLHRLEAFPFQRFGVFEGELLAIEQVLGEPAKGASVGYSVKARVVPLPNTKLALGMKVQSDIVKGRKRLKDLVLDKLFGASR